METEKKKKSRSRFSGMRQCVNQYTHTQREREREREQMCILNNCVQHRHYEYHEATHLIHDMNCK
jgi:hypothetical protein